MTLSGPTGLAEACGYQARDGGAVTDGLISRVWGARGRQYQAEDDGAVGGLEVNREQAVVGMPIIPPHRLSSRKHPLKVLPLHAQLAVVLRAVRQHYLRDV
eukprot:2309390-Pyramimonas_sp.AAC.1